MAKELVTNLLAEAERNKVIKIVEIHLEIGEISFLQEDQLKYSFDIIKRDHPVMREAELTITKVALVVECTECEYRGPVTYEDDQYHFLMPLIRCPECDSGVKVVEGKDIIIKNIEAEVEDDDE